MGNRHLLHVRSNQVTNNEPKLPQTTDIRYGELAINYAKGNETISLKNSNDEIVSFNIGKSIKGVNVNNVNATIANNIASVTISGSDENVGTYTSVQYPTEFSAATNVSGSQTIADAFNSVENTVSALTQIVFDDELATEKISKAIAEAAGTIDSNNEIKYNVNENAHYISAATSLADADDILDSKISTINYAESQTTPGGPAKMAVSIPRGKVDSTSTSTVFTAQIDGITELRDGVCCLLTNGVVSSTTGYTLNINGLGAKPVYGTMAAATRTTTIFASAYTMLFIYNETRVEGGCWDVFYGYNSDTNTIGYNISYYYPCIKVSTNLYRYMILLTKDETHLLPVNTVSNNTGTTKTLTTESFDPFGQVYYYTSTTTVSAEATPANATLWSQYYSLVNLRYAFNEGTTLSAYTDVYLVCVPQADGSVKLKEGGHPISQTLPTTEDGYIYKLIGKAYDTYRIVLVQDKPCYYFKDGEIRLWTNQTETDISGKADIGHTHLSSAVTIENDYQEVAYPQSFSGSANVESGQTVTEAFHNVETTVSALTQEVINNETVTANAIVTMAQSAGLINDNDEISYNVNENANYISTATSLADADDILDGAIKNVDDNLNYLIDDVEGLSQHAITSITVNNVNAAISQNKATVTISGSNTNVGTYTSVEYPSYFSGATNVSGSQTIAEAFNSVETTVSALTQAMIDDEKTISEAITQLAEAAGLDDNDEISYAADTTANYISGATSLYDADSLLDSAISNIASSSQNKISGVSVNGVSGIVTDKVASAVISGNNINVGTYTSIEYPSVLSGATPISGNQTINQAFSAVETTISALTQEVLNDELVTEKAIKSLGNAAGTIDDNNTIKYVAPSSAKYISAATSVYDATVLLDTALQNNSGSISSITLNGTAATITNKVAALTASGSSINVGSYTSVTYPASLTGASNVSSGQSVAQAFNSVETTISAVTTAMDNKADKVKVINHGTTGTTFTLPPNEMHVWGSVSTLTLNLATPTDNTIVNEYLFSFTSPLSATTLSLPASVKWVFELVVEPEKTYTISIVDNLATYLTEDMSIIGADESVLAQKEDISNKVTTIDQNSSDIQYPSAKCVYDYIEARLLQLNS